MRQRNSAGNIESFAVLRPRNAVPSAEDTQAGDLFFGRDIDQVNGMGIVAAVRDGERFAVRTERTAQKEVVGRDGPSGRANLPAVEEQGRVAVFAGYDDGKGAFRMQDVGGAQIGHNRRRAQSRSQQAHACHSRHSLCRLHSSLLSRGYV